LKYSENLLRQPQTNQMPTNIQNFKQEKPS
jgi:hypothetical protein